MLSLEASSTVPKLHVLLIGRNYSLAWALPPLLEKAGFNVDVITSSSLMRHCRCVRDCDFVPSYESLLPAIVQRIKKKYDWVVVTEDGTLQEILGSSLSVEEKLQLLPVQREENFCHLFSKIGLSHVFAASGVNTPPFVIAHHVEEALLGADLLGYPVLVKCSASCGGAGVFKCNTPSDFQRIRKEVFEEAVLVQKEIFGVELDVSALYLEGELVHFSYGKVEKVCHRLGPSFLRTYRPLSAVDKQLFQELGRIGRALGAHGFTNISCVEQSDGLRFYFEADMRANVWVDFSRFFGENPSLRIQKWFSHREKLSYPVPALPDQPSRIVSPYFLRLRPWELLLNRYSVWRFMPKEDKKWLARLLVHYVVVVRIGTFLVVSIKRMTPQKYHAWLRKTKQRICRAF